MICICLVWSRNELIVVLHPPKRSRFRSATIECVPQSRVMQFLDYISQLARMYDDSVLSIAYYTFVTLISFLHRSNGSIFSYTHQRTHTEWLFILMRYDSCDEYGRCLLFLIMLKLTTVWRAYEMRMQFFFVFFYLNASERILYIPSIYCTKKKRTRNQLCYTRPQFIHKKGKKNICACEIADFLNQLHCWLCTITYSSFTMDREEDMTNTIWSACIFVQFENKLGSASFGCAVLLIRRCD